MFWESLGGLIIFLIGNFYKVRKLILVSHFQAPFCREKWVQSLHIWSYSRRRVWETSVPADIGKVLRTSIVISVFKIVEVKVENRGYLCVALQRNWENNEDRSKIYKNTANVSCKKCQQHRVNAIFGSSSCLKSWQFYNSGKMTKHTLSYASLVHGRASVLLRKGSVQLHLWGQRLES